jgi:hypothetical protein
MNEDIIAATDRGGDLETIVCAFANSLYALRAVLSPILRIDG